MNKRTLIIHAKRKSDQTHACVWLFNSSGKLQDNSIPFAQIARRRKRGQRMRASTLVALAVLSLQIFFLGQTGGNLAGKGLVVEKDSIGSAQARKSLESSHGASGGEERRQPPVRLRKAAGEAGVGGGIHKKAGSTSQLGTGKKADTKRQIPPLSPPKSKNQGLQEHLKGHGKFNTDTHSCPGIHLKACRKPSDCSGCLGLYTCKLPRRKCDLKAVSRQTGGFSQSIQNR